MFAPSAPPLRRRGAQKGGVLEQSSRWLLERRAQLLAIVGAQPAPQRQALGAFHDLGRVDLDPSQKPCHLYYTARARTRQSLAQDREAAGFDAR